DSDGIYGFEDLTDKVINGPWEVVLQDRGFTADSAVIEQSIENPRPFSQSSYNDFIKCPRMYMINHLVSSPDNTHTLTGNMVHSYAEFRASYPELAKKNGPDYYAKMIAERCAALTSVSLTDVERSKIIAAVRAVDTFMERRGIKPTEYKLRAGSKQEVNMFLEHHGLNEVGDCTEVQVTSAQSHMTGVLDLIWNDIIYDFKTGKIKKSSDLEKATKFEDKGKGKDYQALFYLTLMDNKFRGRVDEMQFIFTLNDYYMNIIKGGTGNIGVTSVVLVDDLGEGIVSYYDDIFNKKKYTKIDGDVRGVVDICKKYGNPDEWKDNQNIISELRQRYKLNKAEAEGALNAIVKLYNGGRFSHDKYLVITYRELEEFKERIASDYERLKEYQRFGFPANPTISCDDCYCRSTCTAEPHMGGEENVSE
ncbi:MAG: PD-(D/E)XK nuclease family protein, partial [Candidatus Methanomethylophilaceae archaeon]|nr:PD-(D/E)XK nuclease family protein [Candidatus Methanomethylophilaceae archaeon]